MIGIKCELWVSCLCNVRVTDADLVHLRCYSIKAKDDVITFQDVSPAISVILAPKDPQELVCCCFHFAVWALV